MLFDPFSWTPYPLIDQVVQGGYSMSVTGLLRRAGDQNIVYILEEVSLLEM